jgi:hypothetical protein
VGGFSDFVDCAVSYLVVFTVYVAVVVFCVVDRAGHHWSFIWIQDSILSLFL